MGVYLKVRSAKTFPKAIRPLYLYLLHRTHEQQRRAQMCSMSETRWAYEEEEVERELAEMTGSLEQVAELQEEEEEESGSSVHGSETCLLEYCSSKV